MKGSIIVIFPPMETADKHKVNFNTVGLGVSVEEVNTLPDQEKKYEERQVKLKENVKIIITGRAKNKRLKKIICK